MTAKEQTEKLREKIDGLMGDFGAEVLVADETGREYPDLRMEATIAILQACKEAGLRFIPETIVNACGDRPTWFENVEEIKI